MFLSIEDTYTTGTWVRSFIEVKSRAICIIISFVLRLDYIMLYVED